MKKQKKVILYYTITSCSECVFFNIKRGNVSCKMGYFTDRPFDKFKGGTIHHSCKLNNNHIELNKDIIFKFASLQGICNTYVEDKPKYVNLNNTLKVKKVKINNNYHLKTADQLYDYQGKKAREAYLKTQDTDDCLYCKFHYRDKERCGCSIKKDSIHNKNCYDETINPLKICLSFVRVKEERKAK